jgi:hypothetical protein
MSRPATLACRLLLGCVLAAPSARPARAAAKTEKPATDAALRGRIAALVLKRADFGAYSFLPVRFAESRLSGPFEDGGHTTWCVSSQMHGRSFGKPERPRAIVRMQGGTLTADAYDSDVCGGHRSELFPEFDALANRKE